MKYKTFFIIFEGLFSEKEKCDKKQQTQPLRTSNTQIHPTYLCLQCYKLLRLTLFNLPQKLPQKQSNRLFHPLKKSSIFMKCINHLYVPKSFSKLEKQFSLQKIKF